MIITITIIIMAIRCLVVRNYWRRHSGGDPPEAQFAAALLAITVIVVA